MLTDRLRWHHDPRARWHDPEAAASVAASQAQTFTAAAASFRYDLADFSEFQRPDPQFQPPPGLRGMVVRVADGSYAEPFFAGWWRQMNALLDAGHLDYCMWYVLPSPNISRQAQLDVIAAQLARSGVEWGKPGHGFSIDDEPTPSHGQVAGQAMRDLKAALEDRYQRGDLHYVGLYSGNVGFARDEGWPLWAPWPTSNGVLPAWTNHVALVMQQWGVAGPGEVPGFPNANVDVNYVFDWLLLDKLTGRDEELTVAAEANILAAVADLRARLDARFDGIDSPGAPLYNEFAALGASVAAGRNIVEPQIDYLHRRLDVTSDQVSEIATRQGNDTAAVRQDIAGAYGNLAASLAVAHGKLDGLADRVADAVVARLGQLGGGSLDVAAVRAALRAELDQLTLRSAP